MSDDKRQPRTPMSPGMVEFLSKALDVFERAAKEAAQKARENKCR